MHFLKKHWILILILLIGAVLRLYDLPRGDAISDEVLYGFRAIGYLDFDFAISQPSTLQLVAPEAAELPAWTKLSFHDHPPLVFLIQHWFMKLFGSNLTAMRMSSALFGTGSILLVFLLGLKLFSRRVGLAAAALMASSVLMLFVSRTGLQESQVIFFMLLTVLLFLKAQDNPRWYMGWGVALGFGLLTKYTIGFLLLPFLAYLLLFQRQHLKQIYVYAGIAITTLVFSPVIIYNLLLFNALGHFDFQLSFLFGQEVPYWQVTPGKEIGTVVERSTGIFKNLWFMNSFVFNLLAFGSIVYSAITLSLFRHRITWFWNKLLFLVIMILSVVLLYLVIGPSARFLSMVIPWLALAIGLSFVQLGTLLQKKGTYVLLAFGIIVVLWEGVFAINSYVLERPLGKEIAHYSRIHWDMHTWGFNELDKYLDGLLQGTYPAQTTGYSLPWLNTIKQQALAQGDTKGLEPSHAFFIYNDNASNLATLWVISRRALYQGWSMVTAESYHETLVSEGDDFFREQGFTDFYFIQNTDKILLNNPERITSYGDELEEQLILEGVEPNEIHNYDEDVAFKVYHFQ